MWRDQRCGLMKDAVYIVHAYPETAGPDHIRPHRTRIWLEMKQVRCLIKYTCDLALNHESKSIHTSLSSVQQLLSVGSAVR